MNPDPSRPVHVLIVEDNRIDARLINHALLRVPDWRLEIAVVDDGDKAVRYLRREHPYERAALPDLVLLDLNLPKREGAEVLQIIRSSATLSRMRVFVLSSSPLDVIEEQIRCAHVKADAYLTKPFDIGSFSEMALEIKRLYASPRAAVRGVSVTT
jgi:DNA-binding response OmpR family regulator